MVMGTCSQCSPLKRWFYTTQMPLFSWHHWFCQRFSLKKEQVPPSFHTTKLGLLIPGKHTLATQDILLSSSPLTKLYEEESVVKMKPPRTFVEAECHCQGGPWPSHRNNTFVQKSMMKYYLSSGQTLRLTSHSKAISTGMHCTIHSVVTQRKVCHLLHCQGGYPSLVFRFG